jgi:hypothetical protein
MKEEAYYITQALKARRLAVLCRDNRTRESWTLIADHYEALAASSTSFYARWCREPLTKLELPSRIGGSVSDFFAL